MNLPLRGSKWSTFKEAQTMTTEEKILKELQSHKAFQLVVVFLLGAIAAMEILFMMLLFDLLKLFEKALVSAAPTCTLWEPVPEQKMFVFRPWRRVVIWKGSIWMQRKWYSGGLYS